MKYEIKKWDQWCKFLDKGGNIQILGANKVGFIQIFIIPFFQKVIGKKNKNCTTVMDNFDINSVCKADK